MRQVLMKSLKWESSKKLERTFHVLKIREHVGGMKIKVGRVYYNLWLEERKGTLTNRSQETCESGEWR